MRSRHEHAIESSRRGNGREHFLAGGRKNSDGTPERVVLPVQRVAQGVIEAGAVVLLAATMTDGRVLPSAGAMLRTIMVVAAVAAASSLVALKVLSARQLRDLPCAPDPPLATTSAITAVDPVLQMVLRSTDVRAALADLLAHDDGTHAPLPELLRRIGLASWEDTPAASATRLARSGRYWLSLRDDDLTPEKYDRLVTLEAVLNLYADLRPDGASRDGGQALDHRLHDVLASTAELMPLPRVGQDQADASVPVGGGEWEARRRFADFAEGVPTAFRVQFDMQANLAAGTFLVEFDVPRPACFSLVSPDDAGRVRAARAYALRSALLAARGAFEADGGISTVVVNCHEHRSKETILSLRLDATSLGQLRTVARTSGLDAGGFPKGDAVRAAFDPRGWLDCVEPFLTGRDEIVSPALRARDAELDDSDCPTALEEATGARHICELGIYEISLRASKWNDILSDRIATTGDAVSKLMSARDATNDVTVMEACNRTAKVLVDGTVDVSDHQRLAEVFVNGDPLSLTVAHIRDVLGNDGQLDAERLNDALGSLVGTLGPVTEMGMYLDDADNVYRYFNSIAERVYYNRNLDDHMRTTRLVPDAYYVGHAEAARILNILGRYDEALAHDDELIRIAPATPDALLTKVRTLEGQSCVFEAADLIQKAVTMSSTTRDLGICFYRLAFIEWKLGHGQLAAACYARATELRSDVADQANVELEELLANDPQLKRVGGEEARKMIEAAGLPYGSTSDMHRTTAACARACTDANLFRPARVFTEMLLELTYDDALVDVYRSLLTPER